MDRNLALELVRVTESAALASARLTGQGKKDDADQAAVTAMRHAFEDLNIRGKIVIGEGERDEAPMLYIGEEVGGGDAIAPRIDIAVDPLEGTNLCAYGRPNAIAVLAASDEGELLHAPDIYMNKIAVGAVAKGVINIDKSPTENLKAIASAKGVYVEDLTVVILERDRHADLIKEVRESGARVHLISDGDVSAAIATCLESSGIDALMGIGGAPEGVLAAAALRCVGGDMQARLITRNQSDIDRCHKMGIDNVEKVLGLHDLASGEVMFAATGVTSGDMLKGVRNFKGGCHTSSLVMRSKTGTIRHIETEHRFDKKANL